jgi:hypothetical protein
MFRVNLTQRRGLTVTTVADDIGILDGLKRYMQARVSFRAVPEIAQAIRSLAASDAVVFYPDGFGARGVQLFIRRLVDHSTLSLVIVVTAEPERFRRLTQSRATANRFIVLGWPAWPWEVFATIQAALPGRRREDAWSC